MTGDRGRGGERGRGGDRGRGGAGGADGGRGRRGEGVPTGDGRGRPGGGGGPHRDRAGRQRPASRGAGGPRSAQAPGERRRTSDPARAAAFDVLRQVAASDAYANLVLPPLLRERHLTGRDAAFATELAYGTLRLRARYDDVLAQVVDRPLDRLDPALLDVLRLGAHQVLGMRVPAHAAVSQTVALARERVGVGPSQMVNAVLRRLTARPADEWAESVGAGVEDPVERLAVRHSHPAWVARALRQALVADGRDAAELEDLLAADNVPPAVTLVARPGLAAPDEVTDAVPDAVAGRWAPTALVLPGGDPADVPGVERGAVGVQDEGSQLVTLALAEVALDPPAVDGERWLDLCAGPGGKAALLGAVAARHGASLVANEVQPHRVGLVRRSVRGLPGDVVEVREGDGRDVGAQEPGRYDRVLVDAPCTGLGALRRRPEARWRRTPADVGPLGDLQRALLTSALAAVRPGGVVAYVTCSPHVAETRLVVQDVLRRVPDVVQLDARPVVRRVAGEIPLGEGPGVQLWPDVHGTDAMFLALLRRTPTA